MQAVLDSPSALVLIGALPTPWSESFTYAWLARLPSSQMLCYTASAGAHGIPLAALPTLISHGPRFEAAKAPSDRAALAAMISTLELRLRLHQELSP